MKRTFTIKIIGNKTEFIKNFKQTKFNYSYEKTPNIKNAQIWFYKKSVENIIKKMSKLPNLTFGSSKIKKHKYQIIETTEIKTLRFLKLKKIMKK